MGKSEEPSHDTKSPPGKIALRREGKMPPGRPAAGGESRSEGILFIESREST